jgi:two-component system OmpR family response regulator
MGQADRVQPLSANERAVGRGLRALVIEDEPRVAEVLMRMLTLAGWQARPCLDGSSAVSMAAEFAPHAVILDVGLLDIDGFEVLRRLRSLDPALCVLFLTDRDSIKDRVAGIRAGGDDYVTKPFSMEEVLARLRGLIRRVGAQPGEGAELTVDNLMMDEDSREVWRGNDLIELTATEFELLRFLMRNPRQLLSKAQILPQVWDYDFDGNAHVVELYISYLRKKIDAGRTPMIHTSRGIGYMTKPA